MIRHLLQVPLSVKLLVANGVLLVAAAVTGIALGRAEPSLGVPLASALFLGILLGMIGTNWVLVKIALAPVKRVEVAADRVARGRLDERVRPSLVADRSLARLIRTFNQMARSMAHTREVRDRLARDLLEAGERDRKALAEELLSGPAQSLSTALLLFRRNRAGSEATDLTVDAVRVALEELRRISTALHPPELDELGLATALRALVRSRLESRGIVSEVEVEGTGGEMSGKTRLEAFRLVQEGVELAARTPGLSFFSLWLRREGPVLLVHLELMAPSPEPTGSRDHRPIEAGTESSLRRMAERSRLLGGEMEVQMDPGSDLALRIRIPVEPVSRPSGSTSSPPESGWGKGFDYASDEEGAGWEPERVL